MPVFDTAEVEIVPELDSFDNELDSGIDRAMQRLQERVQEALQEFESNFDDAAESASGSLDDIDPDFENISSDADEAGADVESAFEDAAEASDEALSGIDGDFSGLEGDAESAAESVADSFDGVGDEIADEFDAVSDDVAGTLDEVASSATSAGDEAAGSFDGVGAGIADEFTAASGGVQLLIGAVGRLAAVIGGLAALRQATLDAEELNSQMIILESQFDETGRGAGFVTEELRGMARESAIRLGIDTSDVVRAQQQVLLFTDLTGEGFNRATELAADMAAFMGRDVPNAARLLSRALDDPTLGLQLLERQAGRFSEALIQQVEDLDAAGRSVEAQSLILEELEGRFGSVAEASADSSARIAQAGRETLREFGEPVIGAIDANADTLISLVESLAPVAENLGEVFGTTVEIIAALSPALEGVAQIVAEIPTDLAAAAAAALAFNRAISLITRHPVVALLTGLSLAIGQFIGEAEDAAPAATELELSIQRLVTEGRIDEVGQQLIDAGVAAREAREEIGGFQFRDLFDELVRGAEQDIPIAEERMQELQEQASSLDFQFQRMVRDGGAGQVQEAINLLGQEMGFTGEEFEEIAERIFPETFAAMQLVEEQAEETAMATRGVRSALDEIQDSAERAPRQLGQLAVAIRDSEDAATDAAVAAEELGLSEEELLEITPEVADEFERLAQSVEANMPGVGDAVENAMAAAEEAQEDFTFEDFVEELETTLTNARNFNTNIQLLIDAGFTDIARIALERGPEFAAAAADALSDPQVLRDAEGLMDDIETEVDTGLDNAAQVGFRGARDAGNSILNGFENGTTGAGAVGRAAANGVISGIGQRGNAAERAGRGIVQGAVNSARGRAGRAFNAGTDFSSGLIAGIDSQSQSVANSAASVAGTAVAAARGVIRALSPSRETAEQIGIPFAQGIAVGIEEAGPEVTSAAERTMTAATQIETPSGERLGRRSEDVGGGRTVLEIRSAGSDMDDLLVEILTRAIRIRGGDVQQVLGQRERARA